MSPLPETLVHYRTDLEEAIGREQAARLRQGRRRQRLVALAAGILVVGLLVTPAFGHRRSPPEPDRGQPTGGSRFRLLSGRPTGGRSPS